MNGYINSSVFFKTYLRTAAQKEVFYSFLSGNQFFSFYLDFAPRR